jgi:hypothetical protein
VGQARGFIQRSEQLALSGTTRVPLENVPRGAATLTDVISVTNVNEVTPYDSGLYEVNYDDAVDEIQQLTISATGGTFTISFGDEETADVAYNASGSAVESALESLSNIEVADVSVSGNGPYVITFAGQYADTDLDEITINTSGLTGPSPAATVETLAHGGVVGTIRRSDGSTIPDGASVTVVYRYIRLAACRTTSNSVSSRRSRPISTS